MYIRSLRHVVRSSSFARLRPFLARFEGTASWTEPPRPKKSKPLRILFCGSDEFSSASLRALHAEQRADPQGILSIDVLCRPGKRAGRGRKTIRDPPIKAVAEELGLTVHERDTFTGWELPRPSDEPINLIIAVSFGLFVPPRILKSAEYGGLNVHPSLLPNLRGPAPLQHTILSRQPYGVSLQTLDDKSFDNGIILAQTPQSKATIPHVSMTYPELLENVTPTAAQLLVNGIKDKVFVPPLVPAGWYSTKKLVHAPKITSADREIDWGLKDAVHIARMARAVGRPWSMISTDAITTKRFTFEDIEIVPLPEVIREWYSKQQKTNTSTSEPEIDLEFPVRFIVSSTKTEIAKQARLFVEDGNAIIIAARDRKGIRIKEITVEGDARKPAAQVMRTIDERGEWTLIRDKNRHLRPMDIIHNGMSMAQTAANLADKFGAIGPKIRMVAYGKMRMKEKTQTE